MTSKNLEPAYGGVIFDTDGGVLLREPANHKYGNVWTFSKGRPEPGETPDETALRETWRKPECSPRSLIGSRTRSRAP